MRPIPSPPWRPRLRPLLLGTLLLALLLAWWDPPLPWTGANFDLVVLLDRSTSAAHETWPDLAEGLGRLPDGVRLGLVSFASTPSTTLPPTPVGSETVHALLAGPPPRARHPNATDLAAALGHALRVLDPHRPGALLLTGDGRQTRGDARPLLEAVKRADLPVYWLAPSEPKQADAWIEGLRAPARMRQGEDLPVTIAVAADAPLAGTLALSVDGVVVRRLPWQAAPNRPAALRIVLETQHAGWLTLEARLLEARDRVAENDVASAAVAVDGPPALLYVSAASDPAPARALAAGGYTVRRLDPAALPRSAAALDRYATVVLDDVPADAAPDAAWAALEAAVRRRGVGLLVLGGAHSLGAGAYRHSRLETLLPVTAQAPRPGGGAAVLYVVDTSGSMARATAGAQRLALAREAVLASARVLEAGDRVGLLAFAVEPGTVLPLGGHGAPKAALARAWDLAPSGGTRLAPALEAALTALGKEDAEQRLLVLVTDGFLEQAETLPLEDLRAADLEVLVFAVGEAASAGTLGAVGEVIRVADGAELPRLMRREVSRRRHPARLGQRVPRVVQDPPFLPRADWPAVQGYMVSSPRPGAQVYLEGKAGEPLLAAHRTGLGRVAVWTPGLKTWTSAYRGWPLWGRFLAGVVDWVGSRSSDPRLTAHIDTGPAGPTLVVDAVDPEGHWSGEDLRVHIAGPGGRLRSAHLAPEAPGRYSLALRPDADEEPTATDLAGTYAVTLDGGLRLAFVDPADAELRPPPAAADGPRDWLREGLLRPWPVQATPRIGAAGGPRTAALIVALLALLALMVLERLAPTTAHRP